jgi:periplasmic protein TonB
MKSNQLLVVVAAVVAVLSPVRAQEVFSPGNGVTLPTVVREVRPDYTEAAKAEHLEGKVLLGVVVRADGTVGDVTVDESLDKVYGLDDEAVKAATQWTFKPGTKDGMAVAVRVHIEMRFTLK